MSKGFNLKDRLLSFRFAMAGVRGLLIAEHNTRIHLAATVGVFIAGAVCGLQTNEWRWIVLAVTLVWLAEAFNTAFERLGDAISLEHHPQIGIAKDVAAAGVLFASIGAFLIGLLVFGPYLLAWIAL